MTTRRRTAVERTAEEIKRIVTGGLMDEALTPATSFGPAMFRELAEWHLRELRRERGRTVGYALLGTTNNHYHHQGPISETDANNDREFVPDTYLARVVRVSKPPGGKRG